MISVRQKGDFEKTFGFFKKGMKVFDIIKLEKWGRAGVSALKQATPKDTGATAEAWDYKVNRYGPYGATLTFYNSEYDEGLKCPVVIVLQYGHACSNGTYIKGLDFINPALTPIFMEMAEEMWRDLTS